MRLEERITMVLQLFLKLFYLENYLQNATNPQIAIFFFDPTWRGQDMT